MYCRFLRVVGLVMAACLLLAGATTAQARPYKIGMIHWIAYSPLNVADVKGFWKTLGLEVEVVNFGSNQELNGALEHKRIDIACDMMGSWVGMYMAGAPLKIVAETDWSFGGDKIIVKKGVTPEQLKGSTVGIYLNQPSVTYFLNKYLASINVPLKDAQLVELEPEALADNFISGRFQAIVNYDPQALRAERDGGGEVIATSASWEGVIPEGLVARADVLAEIPREDLIKVIQGWAQAVEWSKDSANWAEYMTILNEKTFEGEAPYSEADLKAMLDSVRIHSRAEQLARNKDGLRQYLVDLHAFLKENGMLTKEFAPEDLLAADVAVDALSR
ncbi:ABC transporter substrate-binding protein [Megalodesulfovibrio gigas]|nr:ABC transporter substrate-binding protein [Megalodesulfovibrio gigas]